MEFKIDTTISSERRWLDGFDKIGDSLIPRYATSETLIDRAIGTLGVGNRKRAIAVMETLRKDRDINGVTVSREGDRMRFDPIRRAANMDSINW